MGSWSGPQAVSESAVSCVAAVPAPCSTRTLAGSDCRTLTCFDLNSPASISARRSVCVSGWQRVLPGCQASDQNRREAKQCDRRADMETMQPRRSGRGRGAGALAAGLHYLYPSPNLAVGPGSAAESIALRLVPPLPPALSLPAMLPSGKGEQEHGTEAPGAGEPCSWPVELVRGDHRSGSRRRRSAALTPAAQRVPRMPRVT